MADQRTVGPVERPAPGDVTAARVCRQQRARATRTEAVTRAAQGAVRMRTGRRPAARRRAARRRTASVAAARPVPGDGSGAGARPRVGRAAQSLMARVPDGQSPTARTRPVAEGPLDGTGRTAAEPEARTTAVNRTPRVRTRRTGRTQGAPLRGPAIRGIGEVPGAGQEAGAEVRAEADRRAGRGAGPRSLPIAGNWDAAHSDYRR
jgi:hypothetical protein